MINAIKASNNFSFKKSLNEQSQEDCKHLVEIKDHYSPYDGKFAELSQDEFDKYQEGVTNTKKTIWKSTLLGLGFGVVGSACINKFTKGIHVSGDSPLAGAQLLTAFFSSMVGFIVGSEIGYSQNSQSLGIPERNVAKMAAEKVAH